MNQNFLLNCISGLPDFSATFAKEARLFCAHLENFNYSDPAEIEDLTLFDLSSHHRARTAIQFGLKMRNKGFHVFVVGEDRSGRMDATLTYLKQHIRTMPPAPDWVYLNHFSRPHSPKPFPLPWGMGKDLQNKLNELIKTLQILLSKIARDQHFFRQIDALTLTLQQQIDQQINHVQQLAHEKGYEVVQENDNFSIEPKQENLSPTPLSVQEIQEIKEKLNKLSINMHLAGQKIDKKTLELKRSLAKKLMASPFQKFHDEFGPYLGEWIDDLRADILDHIDDFIDAAEAENTTTIFERYSVNLFIHHAETSHPRVVLEGQPTYENLFGSIKYRTGPNGGFETHYTMIRPGALHWANGGILVLRAETLAQNPDLWEALKAALRDRKIRLEERGRDNTLPLVDAPEPTPIPLDVQVFLIASPQWYYNFFFNDPDFRIFFKVKAEIDPDLPATPENLYVYRRLIKQQAEKLTGTKITAEAINYLMGYSARWAEHRERLTSRFELIFDVLVEAAVLSDDDNEITVKTLETVIHNRRVRNARLEDTSAKHILEKQICIQTEGSAIGQVNALTVIHTGDHQYGLPTRLTATACAGEGGLVNIEQLTEMSGPLQQKSAYIIDGFLKGLFAQEYPFCCSYSLAFEQNYSGVEGDSASLAEGIAILSAISKLPVRQDLAITGSMNQLGEAQSVGGIHFKVEGFHRICKENHFTGTQGVIIPESNLKHLTLREEVFEDIRGGKFFIWSVKSIFEAIPLMFNHSCGLTLSNGLPMGPQKFKKNSVFQHVQTRLKKYHALTQDK